MNWEVLHKKEVDVRFNNSETIFILLKHLCKSNYRQFIQNVLKESTNILLTIEESGDRAFPDLGDAEKIFSKDVNYEHIIRYHEIGIYYNVTYYKTLEMFEEYDSLLDFIYDFKIWKIWFMKENDLIAYVDYEDKAVWSRISII